MTLFELLVALAVAGIVAGIGVPALQDARSNARRVAAVNAMLSAIWSARSLAMTTGASVVLCQANRARACGGSAERWAITTGPAQASSEAPDVYRIVRVAFDGELRSNRSEFEFRPLPDRSTNGTIHFCDRRAGRHQRAIVVSYTGRPRLAQPTSEAGFPACSSQ